MTIADFVSQQLTDAGLETTLHNSSVFYIGYRRALNGQSIDEATDPALKLGLKLGGAERNALREMI